MDKNLENQVSKKKVSIVLAIRNEETHISKCMDSLMSQDYPRENYEIVIVDGMSTDKTVEILNKYAKNIPRIRIFNNPRKNQASGRNIGIQNSVGEIIIIFSGHAVADRSFLDTLVAKVESSPSDVAGVGAVHTYPQDESEFGMVVGEIQNSVLGGGGTSYRQKSSNKDVQTIGFCAYRKTVLQQVGLYDERFDIGEDVEINWRIRQAGYRLIVTQDAKVFYYRKHDSFRLLANRMIKYGIWRALVTKKHPRSFNLIFSIPILILVSIILLPVLIIYYNILTVTILLVLGFYFFMVLIFSLILSIQKRNVSFFFVAIPVYLIEHLCIALGFLFGIPKRLPQ